MPATNDNKQNKKIVKSLTLAVMLFVVLLIASVVLLFFVVGKEESLSGADQAIRLSAQGGFECEYAEAQKLYPYGEGVLKVTDERIAYLTLSGNEIYSSSVNYQNPTCVINGGYAAVCDIDGYAFSMYSTENLVYSISTDQKIKSAYVSDDGLCAIITDSSDAFGEIIIYDTEGNFIAQWISYDSGYPLAVQFNSDSSMLAVSTVNTDGATYESYVKLFSIEKTDSKYYAEDYAIYSIEDDTIVSCLTYVGDKLFAFSADSIYVLGDSGFTALDLQIGVVNYEMSVGDMLYIIYSDGVDQVNKIAILNSNGEIVYNSPVGSQVNAYCVSGDYFALSIDRRIYVFDSDGTVITDTSVDEDVLRIGYLGNGKLVVVSTSGVHTITY